MLAHPQQIPISNAQKSSVAPHRPTVLAFEMQVRGHHADYIRNFADAWIRHDLNGNIHFLVTPSFMELHATVVEFIRGLENPRVSISSITPDEQNHADANGMLREYRGWQLFCKYAADMRVDHGLMMYFDHFQIPSVIGARPPCPFSVIYFRPTFHYPTFLNYRDSWRDRFKNLRKSWVLQRVLSNRKLAHVFCLDQYVVPYIKSHFNPRCAVSTIADAFTCYPRSPQREHELRQQLGIEHGRKVFCILGVLDSRKGVSWLLKSLFAIAPELQHKLCILILGYATQDEAEQIGRLIAELRRRTTIQIVFRDEYIESQDVQHFYHLSDVILTTYQQHMGSSAAIVRAAHAEKPVLSSDYGFMGEVVSRRKLGITVNTSDVHSIARGLERFLNGSAEQFFDREEAVRYASEHSQGQLAHDLERMLNLIPKSHGVAHVSPPMRATLDE